MLSSVALAAFALSACASTGGDGSAKLGKVDLEAQSGVMAPDGMDPLAHAAFWGSRYDRDPNNKEYIVSFAQALRQIKSNAEAISVLERALRVLEDDPDVQLELGKTLTADGRAYEGVRFLQAAIAARPADWQALSAYGVALDQIGEHKEARTQYDAALAIAPDAIPILNNKALSLALSGKLSEAELMLRRAASAPSAPAKVRQNLALVLGMKGKFDEAERLARADLPPPVAENNIEYYRSLLSQPAYWQDLKELDFGPGPDTQSSQGAALADEPVLSAPLKAVTRD